MIGRRFLIKSGGELEEYSPNKLAIVCLKIGVPFRDVDSIVSMVSSQVRDGMSTSELRAIVFSALREKQPEAARNYKKTGEFFVRTTEGWIEKWDREKIVESLVRETGIEEKAAQSVSKSVEKHLQNLNLDFVSAPLMREMVNVNLLERGLEAARAKYTRLGLPVYDVARLLERTSPEALISKAGSAVLEQYFLLDVPRYLTDAHFRGVYDIPNLTEFPLHPLSIQHDMGWFLEKGIRWNVYAKPAKHAETVISHCIRIFRASSRSVVEQGMNSLDSILSNFKGDFKQLAQDLLYTINQERVNCYSVFDLKGEFSSAHLDEPSV